MSDRFSAPPPPEADAEEVDGLPVLAAAAPVSGAATPPSLQLERIPPRPLAAAAVAASGFLAGAAVAGLLQRRRQRRLAALRPARGRRGVNRPVGELVQIVGSRSLLVDVHLLSGRD